MIFIYMKASIIVKGKITDDETRCVHYHSLLDVIAIKFKCCNQYYPCYTCHEEAADHAAKTWSKNEFGTKAILCGVCKNELTIHEYLTSNNQCPFCKTPFNPKCKNHQHLYFEQVDQ